MNIQRQPQVLAMLERRQLAPTTTSADMLPAYQHRSCGALCLGKLLVSISECVQQLVVE